MLSVCKHSEECQYLHGNSLCGTGACGPEAMGSSVDPCHELLVSSQGIVQRYHHSLKGIGAPTGVALDDRRAGNQASSLPEPWKVAAERA
jgi:hypothetical protein